MVGHATLVVRSGGKTLLTDPWLVDPIGFNSGFHFPPLVHDPRDVAATTDAIYISHIHPDHLNRASLDYFSREIPVYIGDYRRKEFRDQVRALGFAVVEVPFQQAVDVDGTDFRIAILEHDYAESAAYDSAIVIATPAFTVFENNDCFLRPDKYHWVRDHFRIDYAFLGYSPASFFPVCFEMDAAEKERLLAEASERRYADFIGAAEILDAGLSFPFASGARFLLESALWKNVGFNSADEALRRLDAIGLRGDVLGPGDFIAGDGTVHRHGAILSKDEELAAIEEYASEVQSWVSSLAERQPPVADNLVERFRDYIVGRWRETRDVLPGVRDNVIAYVLVGGDEKRFYLDFSKPDNEILQWGEPPTYDMRYTYPAGGLQLVLEGELDWDQLHFANHVSVHQVNYAKEYYTLLRSDVLDLR